MGRQDQNGTPRTRKRRPRVMEPRSPRWLHVSSRQKWPPQNLEKTPAGHGATKASLAPWLSRSKMAPQRLGRRQSGAIQYHMQNQLISYAITIYGRPLGVSMFHFKSIQIDVVDPYGASIFENKTFPLVFVHRILEMLNFRKFWSLEI